MRNNQRRAGQKPESAPISSVPTAHQPAPLAFSAPTEFVELPSRGEFYPEDHPFYKQEAIEIRFMTAKDEDILTSEALLKKNLAIDRLYRLGGCSRLGHDSPALIVKLRPPTLSGLVKTGVRQYIVKKHLL